MNQTVTLWNRGFEDFYLPWSLHFSAVASHARWPAVSCHNLYEHSLLKEPLRVHNGLVEVPEAPGLGREIAWNAVERFRIEPIEKPYPHPDLLIRVTWSSGAEDYYAHGLQYWDDFINAGKPVFSPGVSMDVIPNDGSDTWQQRYFEALRKPSWVVRDN